MSNSFYLKNSDTILVSFYFITLCILTIYSLRIYSRWYQHRSWCRTEHISTSAQFVAQSADQGAWPTRLWLRSTGGDPAQPLLLTARQRSGALTWQLPYHSASGRRSFHEITRTLCYDAYAVNAVDSPDCGQTSSCTYSTLNYGPNKLTISL